MTHRSITFTPTSSLVQKSSSNVVIYCTTNTLTESWKISAKVGRCFGTESNRVPPQHKSEMLSLFDHELMSLYSVSDNGPMLNDKRVFSIQYFRFQRLMSLLKHGGIREGCFVVWTMYSQRLTHTGKRVLCSWWFSDIMGYCILKCQNTKGFVPKRTSLHAGHLPDKLPHSLTATASTLTSLCIQLILFCTQVDVWNHDIC